LKESSASKAFLTTVVAAQGSELTKHPEGKKILTKVFSKPFSFYSFNQTRKFVFEIVRELNQATKLLKSKTFSSCVAPRLLTFTTSNI
jgi:hypothetical protein